MESQTPRPVLCKHDIVVMHSNIKDALFCQYPLFLFHRLLNETRRCFVRFEQCRTGHPHIPLTHGYIGMA